VWGSCLDVLDIFAAWVGLLFLWPLCVLRMLGLLD
jgi:hypothetical protein